jgi:hypothetical protein
MLASRPMETRSNHTSQSLTSPALAPAKPLQKFSFWLQTVIIAAGILVGAQMRFSLPFIPFLDPDSAGYTTPGMNFFNDRGLTLIYSRSYPYPFFIGLILRYLTSFEPITAIQHVLGLFSGVVVWQAFRRLGQSIKHSTVMPELLGIGGALLGALLLVTPSVIVYEHFIRPESLYPLLVATIFFASASALRSFIKQDRGGFYRAFVAVIGLNIFSYYYRPNIGFGIFLGPALAMLALFILKDKWLRKLVAVVVAAGVVLCTTVLPQRYFFSLHRDVERTMFLPLALVACHAPLILPIVEEELRNRDFSAGTEEQITVLRNVLAEGLRKTASGEIPRYNLLGINPDFVMYGSPAMTKMRYAYKDPADFAAFGYHYFFKMVRTNPLGYLNKVRGQLSAVYGRHLGNPVITEAQYDLPKMFSESKLYIAAFWHWKTTRTQAFVATLGQLLDAAAAHFEFDGSANTPLNQVNTARTLQPYLNVAHWWLALALLPLLLTYSAVSVRRGRALSHAASTNLLLGGASAFLLIYNFLYCLSIAVIGSLEVGRYIQANYLGFNAFSLCAVCFITGIVYHGLSAVAAELRKPLKKRQMIPSIPTGNAGEH